MERKGMGKSVRLIDADALISVLEDMRERHRKNLFFVSANAYDGAVRIVKAIKTIEARPVVHGVWIEKHDPIPWCDDDVDVFWECSVCTSPNYGASPFCPNCGANNRGEADDQ